MRAIENWLIIFEVKFKNIIGKLKVIIGQKAKISFRWQEALRDVKKRKFHFARHESDEALIHQMSALVHLNLPTPQFWDLFIKHQV